MILQYDKPRSSHVSLSSKSTTGLRPTNTFFTKFETLFPSYFQEKNTHLSPIPHNFSTLHHRITVVSTKQGSLTSTFQAHHHKNRKQLAFYTSPQTAHLNADMKVHFRATIFLLQNLTYEHLQKTLNHIVESCSRLETES